MSLPFQIALCCNGTMLPGLHATLGSLVKNLSRRELISLTIFIDDIGPEEQDALSGTITDAGGVGACTFQTADVSAFKDLKTLHGQWMTYLRLLLPNLLPDAATILYLDSDLIIHTDACAFFDHPLENFPVAAVDAGEVEWALDHTFLESVGISPKDHWFNAGILVLNADLWRKEGLIEKSLDMARTHNEALISHDQSVLNALFCRNFYNLPKQFNWQISPTDKPLPEADCIYHFVGSPKPWDPLGRFFHRNWKIWNTVIRRTQFSWNAFLAKNLRAYLTRAWSLRRSYARTWLRR